MTLVEFRNVTFAVNSGPPIIDELNFTVAAGETLVLLGESGCGKTTTLRLVNRLLAPTAGVVLVEGKPTTEWDVIRLRRRTGYVIQEAGLFPHFTVAENVALVPSLENWPEEKTRARVEELLSLVGLEPGRFADRYPRELSGGQLPAKAGGSAIYSNAQFPQMQLVRHSDAHWPARVAGVHLDRQRSSDRFAGRSSHSS